MPHLEIEKHPNGVGQSLANKPRLVGPQITHAATRPGKVCGQLGLDRCDDFAPAGTRAHQAKGWGRRHPRARWGHDMHALLLGEPGLLIRVHAPFVCRHQAPGIASTKAARHGISWGRAASNGSWVSQPQRVIRQPSLHP